MTIDAFKNRSQQLVHLSRIHEWPDNPRRTHNVDKHDELRHSVRAQGLLQPLFLRPRADGDYEVICGNRRRRVLVEFAAAGELVSADVPCLIAALTDDEALAAALKENGDRDDLLPLEEAEALNRLALTKPIEEVAALTGKTETHIRQRLRLLRLAAIARLLLAHGHLPVTGALQLAQLESHEEQVALLVDLRFDLDDVFALIDGTESIGWREQAKAIAGLSLLTLQAAVDNGRLDLGNLLPETGPPSTGQFRQRLSAQRRTLSSARFPIVDGDLVPTAGACTACPKTTGAQASLFGASSADVCLDNGCWTSKVVAHGARVLANAERDGRLLVLPRKGKTWEQWGEPRRLTPTAPYVDIYDDVAGTRLVEGLNDDEKAQIVIAVDAAGETRELIAKEIARAAEDRMRSLKRQQCQAVDGDDVDDSDDIHARQEQRRAEQKQRQEEFAAREAVRLAAQKTEAEAFAAISARLAGGIDSTTLCLLVAAASLHQLPELIGIERTGAGPLLDVAADALRAMDDAGRTALVVHLLCERVHGSTRRDLALHLLGSLNLGTWDELHARTHAPPSVTTVAVAGGKGKGKSPQRRSA